MVKILPESRNFLLLEVKYEKITSETMDIESFWVNRVNKEQRNKNRKTHINKTAAVLLLAKTCQFLRIVPLKSFKIGLVLFQTLAYFTVQFLTNNSFCSHKIHSSKSLQRLSNNKLFLFSCQLTNQTIFHLLHIFHFRKFSTSCGTMCSHCPAISYNVKSSAAMEYSRGYKKRALSGKFY
jgi:hypothetical protein